MTLQRCLGGALLAVLVCATAVAQEPAGNGTQGYTVDRIGRGTLHIPALCLSVFGGIQPGPLSTYVHAAAKGGIGDDGLLQRFQILVWPDAPSRWRNVDRWPNSAAKDRAYSIFEKLDKLTAEQATAVPTYVDTIPALRFSPEAQEVFNEWRQLLEHRLIGGIEHPALEAHLAKYRSLMPSLALIFHMITVVDGHPPGPVAVEPTIQAAAWCKYLESHATRLYASLRNPEMESARELLKHIQRGDLRSPFVSRDVYRKCWTRLASSEEVQRAIDILADFGWVKTESTQTAGRHKTEVYSHPKLST